MTAARSTPPFPDLAWALKAKSPDHSSAAKSSPPKVRVAPAFRLSGQGEPRLDVAGTRLPLGWAEKTHSPALALLLAAPFHGAEAPSRAPRQTEVGVHHTGPLPLVP